MEQIILLTTKAAMRLAGVSRTTFMRWVRKRLLKPRARTPSGSPRYHPDDVLIKEHV